MQQTNAEWTLRSISNTQFKAWTSGELQQNNSEQKKTQELFL